MNPLDFLIVARRLSSSAKESDARTSIGRTYYALFNHLKIKIEPIKEVPVSSEAHQALVRYLLKSNNKTLSSVGQCLNDLRKNRNDADYKMALVLDKTKSELAVERADRALAQFATISDPILTACLKAQPTYQSRRAQENR